MAKEGVHEGGGVLKEEGKDVTEEGGWLRDLRIYLQYLQQKAVEKAKVEKEKERTSKTAQHREKMARYITSP